MSTLLESKIGRAYGYGQYERIAWGLDRRDGKTGLIVTPVDKCWGPSFITFGLKLSDDFDGRSDDQLTAEGTFTGCNFLGGEWRNRIDLGAVAGVRSEWFQPFGGRAQFSVQPYLEYRAEQTPLRVDGLLLAEYRLRRASAGLEVGWTGTPTSEWRAGVLRGRVSAERRIGNPQDFIDVSESFGALVFGWTRDTLDNVQFPRSGSRIELDAELYRDALGSPKNDSVLGVVVDRALEHGADRWLIGLRGQLGWGDSLPLVRSSFLGGFANLSGFTERELVGTQSLLMRTVYYRQFGDATRLFSVPAYIGVSLEGGNVWDTRDQISLDSLIIAGSLFVGTQTPFGPVFVAYGHNTDGASAWYLNVGSLLRPRR